MMKDSEKNTVSLTGELAEKIRLRIVTESLAEGEFFMTEAQLASEYGVSRNIAREAVSRLRALGLLDSRQKRGLIIGRPDPVEAFSACLPVMGQSEPGLEEMAKLRYAIEVGSIDLAVPNATEEQILQLQHLAGQLAEQIRSGAGDEAENKVELAFHSLILEMTGSELLQQMQKVLAKFFQLSSTSPIERKDPEQTIWMHCQLAEAIKDRDLERARTFTRMQYKYLIPQ